MTRNLRSLVLIALIALPCAALALPWDKDMVDQPSQKPQESQAPPGPGSVPTTGRESLPVPTDENEAFEAREAAVSIPNPVPATEESAQQGAALYEVNCMVCHGGDGRGQGIVGLKFETAPADLTEPFVQELADGQMYYALTRGKGAMPFYRDALSPEERWHVINYIRREFGNQ